MLFCYTEASSCFKTVYVKQHFRCVKPKSPGAVGISGTPTVGVSNNWVDVSRTIASTAVAAARTGQACGRAAQRCLTCAPSRKRNCHSLTCHSAVLNNVGTRGIFLTFKSRKGGKKHHFTNFTFSVGSRAFSASFCSFHWPNLVRSHTYRCYHTSSVPKSM